MLRRELRVLEVELRVLVLRVLVHLLEYSLLVHLRVLVLRVLVHLTA